MRVPDVSWNESSENDADAEQRTVERLRCDERALKRSDADVADGFLVIEDAVADAKLGVPNEAPADGAFARRIGVGADAEAAAEEVGVEAQRTGALRPVHADHRIPEHGVDASGD